MREGHKKIGILNGVRLAGRFVKQDDLRCQDRQPHGRREDRLREREASRRIPAKLELTGCHFIEQNLQARYGARRGVTPHFMERQLEKLSVFPAPQLSIESHLELESQLA